MKSFKFGMTQVVYIDVSGESGTVVGRAEYEATENTYLLRYKSADGVARESWWNESALRAA